MQFGVVAGVFALIFVAELPDKTMIATLIMGSRYRPVLVWIGATAAFGVHAALAVLAGRLLALLPHAWVEAVTALLFGAGAAYLLLVSEETEEEEGEEEVEEAPSGLRPIGTAFLVILVGEFGDLTQIQAANFEARLRQPLEVFLASSLALIAVSFIGAYSGRALQRRIPLKRVRLGGGLIFAGLGIATITSLIVSIA